MKGRLCLLFLDTKFAPKLWLVVYGCRVIGGGDVCVCVWCVCVWEGGEGGGNRTWFEI